MDRRGRLISLTVAVLVLGGAGTAAEAQVVAVAGAGSRTCSQMQADIAELPNVRRAYVSWMQGYLSGRNSARENAERALVDLADYEEQWTWVVGWCGMHAERTFAEAAAALFAERVRHAISDP